MIEEKHSVFFEVMTALVTCYLSFIAVLASTIHFDFKAAASISHSLVWVVDLLPKVGIPFHDGFLSGPWPADIYRVLAGFSAWFVVAANIAIGVHFAVRFDLLKHPTNMATHQIRAYNCEPYSGKIIRSRIGLFVVWIFASAVCWDGFSGAATFYVQDGLVAFALPLIFGFTGAFVVMGALLQVSYVALDVMTLLHLE